MPDRRSSTGGPAGLLTAALIAGSALAMEPFRYSEAPLQQPPLPDTSWRRPPSRPVEQWRYTPSTVNEWPQSLPFTVVVTFEIQRRDRKAEAPPLYDAETLAKKRRKVLALISDLSCRDDSQCASLAFGSKPCGGPRENRVYSTAWVDAHRLSEAVADYNAYEAGWNQQEELQSDCAVATEAQPACVQRNCIDRNLAR